MNAHSSNSDMRQVPSCTSDIGIVQQSGQTVRHSDFRIRTNTAARESFISEISGNQNGDSHIPNGQSSTSIHGVENGYYGHARHSPLEELSNSTSIQMHPLNSEVNASARTHLVNSKYDSEAARLVSTAQLSHSTNTQAAKRALLDSIDAVQDREKTVNSDHDTESELSSDEERSSVDPGGVESRSSVADNRETNEVPQREVKFEGSQNVVNEALANPFRSTAIKKETQLLDPDHVLRPEKPVENQEANPDPDEYMKLQIYHYQNQIEQLQLQILSLRKTKKYDLSQTQWKINTKHGVIEIYTPTLAEWKEMRLLWKAQNMHHHHLDPVFYRPFMKHTLSSLREYFSQESTVTIKVAKLNGVIGGFVTFDIQTDDYYDTNIRRYGKILELHISQSMRGKSLGKYLIMYAERVFELFGVQYCSIQVSTYNKKAIRFYSNFGYVGRQLIMLKKLGSEEGNFLQSKL